MSMLSWDLFSQVNYWAVAVVALVSFLLGGLWYSPVLFEGAWMSANGYSDEQLKTIQAGLIPHGLVGAIFAYLMSAMALAVLVNALNVSGVWAGAVLGVLVWFGFAASIGLTLNLFSIRPLAAWLIDSGFQLLFLALGGAILAIWR